MQSVTVRFFVIRIFLVTPRSSFCQSSVLSKNLASTVFNISRKDMVTKSVDIRTLVSFYIAPRKAVLSAASAVFRISAFTSFNAPWPSRTIPCDCLVSWSWWFQSTWPHFFRVGSLWATTLAEVHCNLSSRNALWLVDVDCKGAIDGANIRSVRFSPGANAHCLFMIRCGGAFGGRHWSVSR